SMYANWAQDSIIAFYDLLSFYQKGEDNLIVNISWVSIETVLKYIYENYGYLDDFHPNYQEKIYSYDIMRKEVSEQKLYLTYISEIKSLKGDQVNKLRSKFFNEESNIGLK
ncbi:MAG: DUF416 family protein, partial [Flammeovirgaceae bacterium]|nr:DUF416 family protein [Flammeovirgaceae bacterium]